MQLRILSCLNYVPKSTVSQQISYEIGVHTQTVLYPIRRYIGSRYIGSTVYIYFDETSF